MSPLLDLESHHKPAIIFCRGLSVVHRATAGSERVVLEACEERACPGAFRAYPVEPGAHLRDLLRVEAAGEARLLEEGAPQRLRAAFKRRALQQLAHNWLIAVRERAKQVTHAELEEAPSPLQERPRVCGIARDDVAIVAVRIRQDKHLVARPGKEQLSLAEGGAEKRLLRLAPNCTMPGGARHLRPVLLRSAPRPEPAALLHQLPEVPICHVVLVEAGIVVEDQVRVCGTESVQLADKGRKLAAVRVRVPC
mmetsp:Transcript_22587/g.70896  ORF Transcript_22587/g.70896 Transcript_22587/m.70896 type:complete len:252 (-) Transcript_22587:183-938(-)